MTKRYEEPPPMSIRQDKQYTAIITTAKGDVILSLYASICPVIVNNFVFLARNGFYSDNRIFRVIEGVFVQLGDPTGTGRVGAGYKFDDEAKALALPHKRGTVAMANAGTNSNSSQFFIVLADDVPNLDGMYCVFGHVGDGMAIVDTWVVGDIVETVRIIEQ